MADIISIGAHQRSGYQPPRADGPGAAIIMFPGVRYERPDDAADAADEPRPPKGTARRKS